MTFGTNFLPGPTGVHPDVLAAMNAPMFAHYGPRMRPILEEIQPALQSMFGTTRPVFTVTCSGTGLMEAAIRNAVRRRVLVVISGFFGEYFARIGEACGKEVVQVHVPLGHTLEADQLAALLDGPAVDTVALVHSESSTGALAPLEDLARVVHREPDRMLVVDGVSSAGGVPIDMDRVGIDFMITGSQKALAIPPGLAIGAVSERLERRAAGLPDAGHYFSAVRWSKMAGDFKLFETPALSLYFALRHQLRRVAAAGGWPARWARHRALAERTHAWAAQRSGLSLLAPEGRRSPTVSVLRLERGQDPAAIQRRLDEQGWLVSLGLDPSHGPLLRIGHMGDLEPIHLEGLLAALDPLL
jgi:aspartate aminotransferase-like enzyme